MASKTNGVFFYNGPSNHCFDVNRYTKRDWLLIASLVVFIAAAITARTIWGVYGDSMVTGMGKLGFGLLMGGVGQLLISAFILDLWSNRKHSTEIADHIQIELPPLTTKILKPNHL